MALIFLQDSSKPTVDSVEYKKARLIFYEQKNIRAFKEIFISQYGKYLFLTCNNSVSPRDGITF